MNRNGYRPSHRNRFLLIEHKVLTREEFVVFEYCLDQMGFDRKNNKFGKIKVDYLEIASTLGYSTKPPHNSVRTKINKLVEIGVLIPTNENKIFKIFNPDRYIATSQKWQGKASEFQANEFNQPFEQIVQNIVPDFQITEQIIQPFEQNSQEHLKVNATRALDSSKVNSKLISPLTLPILQLNSKTDTDYLRIYQKSGYQCLPPEDMRWLDEHVTTNGRTIL